MSANNNKPRPSTAVANPTQSTGGRPSSAHPRHQHASTLDPHTSGLTGESGLPAELLQVEDCGAAEEMKAAVVALLKRKPDNPLLFLAAYFNDKLSCQDGLARAYGHVCDAATTETEFMDNASKAYLAMQENSAGDRVTGTRYVRLLKKLIGPGWPKTEACAFKALREPGGITDVPFRDFHVGLRFCMLVRRLQKHACGSTGMSPEAIDTSSRPSAGLVEAYVNVVENIRREASEQSRPEIVEAFSCEGGAYADGAASDHRWSIDLDTFVHDLLLAVTTCSTANPTVSMTASVGQ